MATTKMKLLLLSKDCLNIVHKQVFSLEIQGSVRCNSLPNHNNGSAKGDLSLLL